MIEQHPPASPASSIPTLSSSPISSRTTTTTTTTSSSSSPSSSSPSASSSSNWTRTRRDDMIDSRGSSGSDSGRGRLNLRLNINEEEDSDTEEEGAEAEAEEDGVSRLERGEDIGNSERGLELLSSGLEQLGMNTIRGQRDGEQTTSTSTSSAINWLKSTTNQEGGGLVDNDILEEHWYSIHNTPLVQEAEESHYELISVGIPLDGEEGEMVDDEACYVDHTNGCVDFLSSLPYELSLYILLHLERSSLIASSSVSKQWNYLALDNIIWRDLFHRESTWRIRDELVVPSSFIGYEEDPTGTGTQVGGTGLGGGGTPLRRNSSATSFLRNGGLSSLSSSTILPTSSEFSTSSESISTSTPRRTTSEILSNPFSLPSLNTNLRSSSQQPPSPSPSSHLSRNPSFSTLPPPTPIRRPSSSTIPPLGFVPSPSFPTPPSAPLFLDWPQLYKDRYILEKRWEKGTPKSSWLKGHGDSVYCLQFDQEKVVSGSRDQTIRIWDIKSRQCIKILSGHSGSVLCLQYDTKILVSGSSDSRVLIWDLVGEEGTGKGKYEIKMSLLGHQMGVLDLCFDEKWIVTCSKDTTIRVWDKETGQHYRTLSGHRGPINALQLLNNTVVSASGDGTMKLWSVLTGEVLRVFSGHTRGLACVKYSPTGKLLASGSNDRTIKIWDPDTGKCLKSLKGHKELVRTLSFDETRQRLISGSYDCTIKVWDLESGNLLLSHAGHNSLVFDVSFSASRIVSCSHDHRILILDFGWGLDVSKFV